MQWKRRLTGKQKHEVYCINKQHKGSFRGADFQKPPDYDVFLDDFAHNHTSHLVCNLYICASKKRMRDMYKRITKHLDPLPEAKYNIDESNYSQFIGVKDAYRDLLDFFDQQIDQTGFDKVFNKYAPLLLPGLVGEIAHSLIQLGYAVEVRHNLILFEALALSTLGYGPHRELINQEFSVSLYEDPIAIIQEMSSDFRFKNVQFDPYTDTTREIDIQYFEYTQKYYKAWDSRRPLPRWENLINHPVELLSDKVAFWKGVGEAATQEEDRFAHAIKSIRTMKELAKVYPQDEEIWRHGSRKVLDLVQNPEDWDRKLGLASKQ
ncbi:hypothetical protein K7432_008342 [Basidiobolus ranarum]|uniref:Uncharacterized protein n=1 Tax=Basidiobolus ranarum TaxID=34480 RepID=A0ABR2WRX4_9FUNG